LHLVPLLRTYEQVDQRGKRDANVTGTSKKQRAGHQAEGYSSFSLVRGRKRKEIRLTPLSNGGRSHTRKKRFIGSIRRKEIGTINGKTDTSGTEEEEENKSRKKVVKEIFYGHRRGGR